jgi:hypothetical protein
VTAAIAQRYREFADLEARGVSPLYVEFAAGIAEDPELLALLATLPEEKQQPNLILAATRYVAGLAADYGGFRRSVLDRRDEVLAIMRKRRTQTNEPGRCAALYPLLASLPQPLALLEVGASAGLCLLPDRYRYEYDGHPDDYSGSAASGAAQRPGVVAGAPDSPVVLRSRTEGDHRQPGPISVAWRAGIDLNPLDVTDPDDARWLEALIWPGDHDRQERLQAALSIARRDRPRIVRGDLNARLDEMVAEAPGDATLVVYHTAVLWYLSEPDRAAFVARVRAVDGHWIAQEGPGVVPGLPAEGPAQAFLVALDGRVAGFSAPHGGWLRWLS